MLGRKKEDKGREMSSSGMFDISSWFDDIRRMNKRQVISGKNGSSLFGEGCCVLFVKLNEAKENGLKLSFNFRPFRVLAVFAERLMFVGQK